MIRASGFTHISLPSKQRHVISHVSVREFTGFCEQIWCVDTCLLWNRDFSNRTSSDQYNSCQTRSKLVTTCRTRVFTWKHMKTRTGGAVPIMNQYDTCQLVQKRFLVCWVHKLNVIVCINTVITMYIWKSFCGNKIRLHCCYNLAIHLKTIVWMVPRQ